MRLKNFMGEALGTFVLVFFGCGVSAASLLFAAHTGLFQMAAVWGIGVTLGIYASRHLSCAHLNPAVSVGMVIARRMPAASLPLYVGAQLTGAFLAAALLYILLSGSIASFEATYGIVRGAPASIATASLFADYFPHPGAETAVMSLPGAMFSEGLGTFLLVLMIFLLTEKCNLGAPDASLAPFFIGATVTALIAVLAPLTQAGLNPARDFGPRLFAWLAGWRGVAIPGPRGGFLTVYIFSPLVGGALAALFFSKVLEPFLKSSSDKEACC